MIKLFPWTLTLGRLIAFICSLFVAFFVWGFIFSKGSSGSNVVLGFFLVYMTISYITRNFGNYVDDQWFFKGDPYAIRLRRAGMDLVESIAGELSKWKRKYPAVFKASPLEKHLEELMEALKDIHTAPVVLDERIRKLDREKNRLGYFKQKRGFMGELFMLVVVFLPLALAFRAFLFEPFQIPSGSMLPTAQVGDHLFVSKLSYGISNPFSKKPSYWLRWADPVPGDVVVFQAPEYVGRHAGEAWIKRVIATEGQKVRLKNSVVYVDDIPYPHVGKPRLVTYADFQDITIKTGVLGGQAFGNWAWEQAILLREKTGYVEHDIYLDPKAPPNDPRATWPGLPIGLNGLRCTQNECLVLKGYVMVMGDNRFDSGDSRLWGGVPKDAIKGKAKVIWVSVDGSKTHDLGSIQFPAFRWDRTLKWIL